MQHGVVMIIKINVTLIDDCFNMCLERHAVHAVYEPQDREQFYLVPQLSVT